ncbi:hypothetical protein ANN_17071 [Periplaneta americana]|uniref:Reverse transcriptase domain-containing protein n=1 Tax=Periplaneta americana TaxID=6978 RepID=A0ABQ8SSY7_PERAM|nr:hypothetical protein ANN_17071 [Periplaneta americana]
MAGLCEGGNEPPESLKAIYCKKAFDSADQCRVLQSLNRQGIQEKYVKILEEKYRNSKAKISLETEFPLQRGVKQGDPILPKLFTSLLEDLLWKLKWENFSISINGRMLSNLCFADDIVLFARSARELTNMLEELNNVNREAGPLMNQSKTKLMTNGMETQVQVSGKTLEYVKDYIYRGQMMSFQNAFPTEVNRRIALVSRKYWSMKFIFEDKFQNLNIKKQTLKHCIISTLLYGCQTWSLTEREKLKLQRSQQKRERRIAKIPLRDEVSATTIRKMTGLQDIVMAAQRLKWKWGGHVSRLNTSRWAYVTNMWDPRTGKRTAGRPRARWSVFFRREAGRQWTRTATCRTTWQMLARRWTDPK